jgi:TetR/AcrR family transcriptional repressor of mexJK operon
MSSTDLAGPQSNKRLIKDVARDGYQPGRPTAAELERRKARALQVATDLFVAHGYAATSLVDIAKGAGIATRTIYQHFGDKEAMFREVIFARNTGAIIVPPALEPGDTVRSALFRTARYASDVALGHTSVNLMRLMIAESQRFPELMRKVATSTFAQFRQNIAKIFEGLTAGGLLPDSDHERSAELFSDVILGNTPIMTYTNWATSPPSDVDLADRIDLFILGRFGPRVASHAGTRRLGASRRSRSEAS